MIMLPSKARHFALTPVQIAMVLERETTANPGVNLEQVVVHLEAPDETTDAMKRAWTAAIARHAALRLWVDLAGSAVPQQRVGPMFDAPLTTLDLTDKPDATLALSEFLAHDRTRGVDISKASGWRLTWVRLAAGARALVWTFSHVFLDGRSFARILDEVFVHYDAEVGSEMPPGFPVAAAFADHCAALPVTASEPALKYFAARLHGAEIQARPGFGTLVSGGAASGKPTLTFRLSVAQTHSLRRCAAAAAVTLSTMVMAAWGIVLARSSGQRDAVFGTTRAGRHLVANGADMIGCLITTIPTRVQFAPGQALSALLADIRKDQLDSRPHEHTPLNTVRSVMDVPADQPLFHSLVMFERGTLQGLLRAKSPRWAQRRVDLYEEGALPLTLAAYEEQDLLLRLEYDPAQIAKADAVRYLDYTQNLLVAMAEADLTAPVASLAMLPDSETSALQVLSKPLKSIALPEQSVAQAFSAQAARTPDALAVLHASGDPVSYAELDRRANRLAHALRARGVGHGDIVALCLPRSDAYIMAALAVLKSGAAFLPLDPTYPADALQYMVQDSQAALILCEATADWMPADQTLRLRDTGAEQMPATAPDLGGMSKDHLAYVIYTSGTTGRPKGVMVSDAALVSHAIAAQMAYGLGPKDRVLQFSSLSFDVSLEEILPTLLCGACLVLRTDLMAEAPGAFIEGITASEVSVLNLPTGFWLVLLDAVEQGATLPPSVRLVIAGGERVPASALTRWRRLVKKSRWMNGYGPTEATITSAVYEATDDTTSDVPIGRPFGHASLHILTPDGAPAPRGSRGELWIGGAAVAMGYLGLPAQTEASFVSLPQLPGKRLYRSGDLAHWGDDDQLYLGGRADRQIKLRGYRIEPGEVEAVLDSLPGVKRSLVALHDAGASGARLVGWVSGTGLDLALMAHAISARLPRQMCPALVLVDDWPMTPGGKVDLKRLPPPTALPETMTDAAPTTPETRKIMSIFGETLGVAEIGADQSFFDAGGHSLLMLGLIGRIEAVFGQRVTPAYLHANPTPRGVAAFLSNRSQPEPGSRMQDCIVPIQAEGSRTPIYGVHVLGVNGSFYRPLAETMGPDQPIFGLSVGLLAEDTPITVEATAELYFTAINAHRPEGPINLMAVSLGSYTALELAQRLIAAGRDVQLLALLDAEGPDGRPPISILERFLTHLAILRAEGPAHIARVLHRRGEELRHMFTRAKRRLMMALHRNLKPISTLDGFVAANELAARVYKPKPYPRRLTVIRAQGNLFDSKAAIEAGLGWASVAAGGLDLIEVPGDHLSILEAPGVEEMARVLQRAMARRD